MYMNTTGTKLATGMRRITAAERAESLRALLAYSAGTISDPGDEDGTWAPRQDDTLTLDDDEGAEHFGPTDHECPEPC